MIGRLSSDWLEMMYYSTQQVLVPLWQAMCLLTDLEIDQVLYELGIKVSVDMMMDGANIK